jgi:SH3-like domain-containing protein
MRSVHNKIFFSCCICLFIFIFSSAAYSADFVTVIKDDVNVRTGPGTNNPVHAKLFEGYPLKVIKKDGVWFQVTDFESDSGWIESSLTRPNDTVIVKAQTSVNLRSGPDISSAVVATVDNGVVLKKEGLQGDWIKVRHSSGISGWIYKNLVWP